MIFKYLGLYCAFFRASLVADLEYRVNFLTRIVTDVFWYAAQILTFEVLYRHTDVIGHWDVTQTRVFLGVLFVVDAVYMILLSENMDRFSDRVRKGELDLILAKPVNSQFMVSLQRASTAILGNLLMGCVWLAWSLSRLPDFSWIRLLWLLLLIPCGLVVLYSCRFMLASLAVVFTRAENLQFLWYQLYKLGMRPDSIYRPLLRFFLLTVFPVALVASVPARALLDPPDPGVFLWAVLASVLFLTLSHFFWKWCLKRYSSASS